MILLTYKTNKVQRMTDLNDIFKNQSAMLVGGAPSLKEQPIELLEQRGLLTMAMNNAAMHFRPTLWVSGDNPHCYDPQILADPTIMKFAPACHARVNLEDLGCKYLAVPNIYFYIQEADIPWEQYLECKNNIPWYNNTLLVAINILYQLGIRRIVLAGSDFGFNNNGDMYAHETCLGDLERKWNLDLYNNLVKEIRMLKPIFESAGLEFIDSSKNSRLAQTYKHVSLKEAVELCKQRFPAEPKDSKDLPHCSKFAPDSIQNRIAKWPGYAEVKGNIPLIKATNKQQQVI